MTIDNGTNIREKQISAAKNMLYGAAIAGIVFGALFLAYAELDSAIVRPFYDGNNVFRFSELATTNLARDAFQFLFVAICVAAIAGVILGRFRNVSLFGHSWGEWAYFLICVGIGPGLLVNLILKDNWGRARPYQVIEFGGEMTFTPVLYLSDQCHHNCSFVSGEAASIYVIFFCFSLMTKKHNLIFATSGIILGTLSGLIRMGQGGHFPSDVVFAGVFMAVIASLGYLIFRRLVPA